MNNARIRGREISVKGLIGSAIRSTAAVECQGEIEEIEEISKRVRGEFAASTAIYRARARNATCVCTN
jgi:hypothetical protein